MIRVFANNVSDPIGAGGTSTQIWTTTDTWPVLTGTSNVVKTAVHNMGKTPDHVNLEFLTTGVNEYKMAADRVRLGSTDYNWESHQNNTLNTFTYRLFRFNSLSNPYRITLYFFNGEE